MAAKKSNPEGASATGKPSGHFVTARSCNVCHTPIGWVPVSYTHLSPQYQAQPDKQKVKDAVHSVLYR